MVAAVWLIYRTEATRVNGSVTNVCFLEVPMGQGAAPVTKALVGFQAGYFCLPTFSKEIQQLLISAPVTEMQQSAARNCCTSLHNTCSLSRQLKNN